MKLLSIVFLLTLILLTTSGFKKNSRLQSRQTWDEYYEAVDAANSYWLNLEGTDEWYDCFHNYMSPVIVPEVDESGDPDDD